MLFSPAQLILFYLKIAWECEGERERDAAKISLIYFGLLIRRAPALSLSAQTIARRAAKTEFMARR